MNKIKFLSLNIYFCLILSGSNFIQACAVDHIEKIHNEIEESSSSLSDFCLDTQPIDTGDAQTVIETTHCFFDIGDFKSSSIAGDPNSCIEDFTPNPPLHEFMTKQVNICRRLVGLPTVTNNLDLSRKSLKAAEVMTKLGALSHDILSTYRCYSEEAAEGAKNSALNMGYSIMYAVLGLINDSSAFNEEVGHRRALLANRVKEIGTGCYATNGSSASCAIWWVPSKLEPIPPRPKTPECVAWPPPGYFSSALFQSDRFSFSCQNTSFENAKITVLQDGVPFPFKVTNIAIPFYGETSIVFYLPRFNWMYPKDKTEIEFFIEGSDKYDAPFKTHKVNYWYKNIIVNSKAKDEFIAELPKLRQEDYASFKVRCDEPPAMNLCEDICQHNESTPYFLEKYINDEYGCMQCACGACPSENPPTSDACKTSCESSKQYFLGDYTTTDNGCQECACSACPSNQIVNAKTCKKICKSDISGPFFLGKFSEDSNQCKSCVCGSCSKASMNLTNAKCIKICNNEKAFIINDERNCNTCKCDVE